MGRRCYKMHKRSMGRGSPPARPPAHPCLCACQPDSSAPRLPVHLSTRAYAPASPIAHLPNHPLASFAQPETRPTCQHCGARQAPSKRSAGTEQALSHKIWSSHAEQTPSSQANKTPSSQAAQNTTRPQTHRDPGRRNTIRPKKHRPSVRKNTTQAGKTPSLTVRPNKHHSRPN